MLLFIRLRNWWWREDKWTLRRSYLASFPVRLTSHTTWKP